MRLHVVHIMTADGEAHTFWFLVDAEGGRGASAGRRVRVRAGSLHGGQCVRRGTSTVLTFRDWLLARHRRPQSAFRGLAEFAFTHEGSRAVPNNLSAWAVFLRGMEHVLVLNVAWDSYRAATERATRSKMPSVD